MQIKKLLKEAILLFSATSTTPALDAELLLAHSLGKNRTYVFAHADDELTASQYACWQRLLEKRLKQIPIAYLLGEKEFWGLTLAVNEHTLIPRPETELLVELILQGCYCEKYSDKAIQILDLGTGSGAIALALAKERPQWEIVAADISKEALNVARSNAEKHDIRNVNFIQSDWFLKIKGDFDIIVSNPPYLAVDDVHLLHEEIRYEPQAALVARAGGFSDIEKIIKDARFYLKPGGHLLIEHGLSQGEKVRDLFKAAGYEYIKTHHDLAGLDRVTQGY